MNYPADRLYPPHMLSMALVAGAFVPEGAEPDVIDEDVGFFSSAVADAMKSDPEPHLGKAENMAVAQLARRVRERALDSSGIDIPDQ